MNQDDRELLNDLSPEELALLDGVDDLLADPSAYEVASPGLEGRIMADVLATASPDSLSASPASESPASASPASTLASPATSASPASTLASSALTSETPAPTSGNVVDLAGKREARAKRRGLATVVPWLVAAAASIVAVGAVSIRSGNAGPTPTAQVALAGTNLAPGVAGTIGLTFEPSGTRIDLSAPALATAPPGSFYQGWVKGDKGLVSVGTFHTAKNVVLWSGVALKDYPTLTVTLEPEDGVQTSSGQVVLTAPVGRAAIR